VDGYYTYWGPDPSGTSGDWSTDPDHDPPPVPGDGTYYLRLQTRDNVGNLSAWETVFTFKVDETPPAGASIVINDGDTFTDDPAVALALNASDATSGIDKVNLRNAGESWAGWESCQSSCSWRLGAGDGDGTVEAQFMDAAGNTSTVVSDEIFLDTTPPLNPTPPATETHDVISGTWQNDTARPTFEWASGLDPAPGSGIEGYLIYWGTDEHGTPDTLLDPPYSPGEMGTGTYYLRLTTKDRAGNVAPTVNMFTFKYDGSPPSNPTTVDSGCDAKDDVWQRDCNDPLLTWGGATDEGSGIAGYNVYWGPEWDGVCSTFTDDTEWDPSIITGSHKIATRYLCIATEDRVGNRAPCQALFTFKWIGPEVDEVESTTVAGAGTVEDTLIGGAVTISTTGQTTSNLTTARYKSNPADDPDFYPTGDYYDIGVGVRGGGNVTTVTLQFCPVATVTVPFTDTLIYWADGSSWKQASDQIHADGCIVVTVTDDTEPDLSDLVIVDLPFARGVPPVGGVSMPTDPLRAVSRRAGLTVLACLALAGAIVSIKKRTH
jgi:hypothetical protein